MYEGWELTGWPVVTLRRGEVVFEDGHVTSGPGSGRLIPRKPWRRPKELKLTKPSKMVLKSPAPVSAARRLDVAVAGTFATRGGTR